MRIRLPTWLLSRELLLALFALVVISPLPAQTTVTWTGASWPNLYTDTAANWQGNSLPLNNGTEHFVFGQAFDNTVYFGTAINAYKVSITGIVSPFLLDDDNEQLSLGAGGLVYAPAVPVTSHIGAYPITLLVDQTWDIQSGELGLFYNLAGSGRLTKAGAGSLALGSTYSWTGGFTLNGGRLVLDTHETLNWTLGSGALVVGPNPGGGLTPTIVIRNKYYYDDAAVITNAVELNGILATESENELSLTGAITLKANTTVAPKGANLFLDGAIGEAGGARKLTVDGPGTVVLSGTNTYTGGTHVQNGVLIFAQAGSVPASPATNALTVAANGYIGFGDDGTTNAGASLTNPQGLFLDHFDKANTFGTVGFDSDPQVGTNTYTGPIDLTGFAASARLGSATSAALSGTITPQGPATAPYRFGGGGGYLQVYSNLVGNRALIVDSPAARPLTLWLESINNSYTGATTITNSALVVPAGYYPSAPGTITINNGGYLGFYSGDGEDELSALGMVNPASLGAIGIDGTSYYSTNINLSAFTGSLYLATTTPGYIDEGFGYGLVVTGTITPAGGASAPYRFAGYKGGQLEINSNLSGPNQVHVGDPNSPATFGDPLQGKLSTVALTGNNSGLTGNVLLYGGQLGVAQANGVVGTDPTSALGSGSLIVQGMNLPTEWSDLDGEAPSPKLVVESNGTIIANTVVLNADLEVGGFSDFALTGTLSGNGELYVGDADNSYFGLTLSGTNTFTGGIYVTNNAHLTLANNTAAGTGLLAFGSSSDAYVDFTTLAPVVGGLSSNAPDDYATLTATLTDTVLTINQTDNAYFNGEFRSNATYPNDNFRIVKSGAGTLRLNDGGLYFYHGVAGTSLAGNPEVSLQVNQGTLVLGSDFYVESSTPTIWVHGGTLLLDGAELYNPVTVDNGGRLGGTGYLAAGINIGTGATLAPGSNANGITPIGSMNFDHLALLGGGTLEWDIMQADVSSNAWDQVYVYTSSTLDFNGINVNDPASAATRFTLKVISRQLNGAQGLLADFNPAQAYSWKIFDTELIAGFDPAKIIIDTSLFANSLNAGAGNGWFFVTQAGNNLMLNFSPVPEPSTYALLFSGLALAALRVRRRRPGN